MSRPPPLALVGSGEYLDGMSEIDQMIIERTGKARPVVALVPTAAGREDPLYWTDLGSAHFAALGAEPVAVLAVDRPSCEDPRWADEVARADIIYFSGGKPGYLIDCIRGTALWRAVVARHAAGAVLVGSSAGAMLFGERAYTPDDFDERGVPRTIGMTDAMAIVPYVVMPHFDLLLRTDELGRSLRAIFLERVAPEMRILGIDEDTALLRLNGAWCVRGRGSVRFLRGSVPERDFPTGASVADVF
jgi:cyanophycinase